MNVFNRKEKMLYLSRYLLIKERILILMERKKAYQDSIYGIKSPNLDGMPHGGIKSDISDKVIECISVTNDIDKELSVLCDKMERMKLIIRNIGEYNERTVIEMKYIDGLSYKQITSITNHSLRTVQRYFNRALDHLVISKDAFEDAMST